MNGNCPYLGTPVPADEFTDEHIFPHAIGGSLDYSIRVSKKANSELGTRLDGPLVDSPLIQALRLVHGVRSRAGEPAWKLPATHTPTGKRATITFRADETNVEIHGPISRSDDGLHVSVVCSPEQDERILKQFLAGQVDRGRLVQLLEETSLAGEYRVEPHVDAGLLVRAMLKIALATAYECLGESVLSDSVIEKCRQAIFAEDRDLLHELEIPGFAFEPPDHPAFLPRIESHEHLAVVANIQMAGLVVGVQLFGGGFHSLFIVLSEASAPLLEVGQGTIAICDARRRKTRKLGFFEHQLQTLGLST